VSETLIKFIALLGNGLTPLLSGSLVLQKNSQVNFHVFAA